MKSSPVPVLSLLLLLTAAPVPADVLLLEDGRIVKGKPMVRVEGGVKIRFRHGEVLVPGRMILHHARAGPDGILGAEDERLVQEFEIRQRWRTRRKAQTEHFAFEYTVQDRIAREYMDLFEAYFAFLAGAWSLEVGEDRKKLKVCFFHSWEYYQQLGGIRNAPSSFRFVVPLELNFFSIRNDRQETVAAALWAETHFLLHCLDPRFRWPRWLGQGLADFYSQAVWDPETRKFKTGGLHAMRLADLEQDLADGKRTGLDFMIRKKPRAYKTGPFPSPWPWSFCHFMLCSPKYAEKFRSFVLALARDATIPRKKVPFEKDTVEAKVIFQLLKKHLGLEDLGVLEKEWHAYAESLECRSPRYHLHAARTALYEKNPQAALESFEKAIQAGGMSHRLFYLYGKVLHECDRNEKAVEMLGKAMEIDPLDARTYMYAGLACKKIAGREEAGERYQRLAMEIDPEDPLLKDLADPGRKRDR